MLDPWKKSYDQPRQHIKKQRVTLPTKVHLIKAMVFNMLSRLLIAFLPRSKCLLISWLWSPSAVILEPQKIKSATVSTVSPSICHEVMGPDAMILVFWMLSFKPIFSLYSFTFIKRPFSSSKEISLVIILFISRSKEPEPREDGIFASEFEVLS